MDTKAHSFLSPGLALMVGTAAGLTAGLLIAGKGGQRLRAEIGDTVDGYLLCAEDKVNEVRAEGSDLAKRGFDKVQEVKTTAADKVKKAMTRAVDSGEEHAHSAIDGTVATVNAAASQSHKAVSGAADSLRTGAQG